MNDIDLTETQKEAIAKTKDWFINRTKKQQIWRLFGFAGTGKSTVLKYLLGELGLSFDGIVPDVFCATFTGKASRVLQRKGTPARTIHSLIYSVSEASEEAFIAVKAELDKLREQEAMATGSEAITARAMIQGKLAQLREMKKPKFGLNIDSPVRDCKLVVVDEVSMVDEIMAGDLMSYGKPILVLGDPGQLPPIRGHGFFVDAEPDIMLEQIHRQAEGSAIIRLATMARQGRWIPFGRHSDDVWKLRRAEVDAAMLASADQVITGMNATRIMLNNALRQHAGRSSELPEPADKILCLKNDNERGLVNGMFVALSDIEQVDDLRFSARLHDEDGNPMGVRRRGGDWERFLIYSGHFQDHRQIDGDRHDRDWKSKKSLVECTFGNAITSYKSQGSGFTNVAFFDDGFGHTVDQRAKHQYTVITRAEKGLLICA